MVYILIAALVVVNIGFLIHLERKDRRFDDAVNRLLQRIQAPEQAVLDHAAHVAVKRDEPLFANEFSEDQEALEMTLRPGEY